MKVIKNPYVRFLIFLALVGILAYLSLGGDITGSIVAQEPVAQEGRFEVEFCQVDDCPGFLMEEILLADDVQCAFYDLDYDALELVLEDAGLLVFEDNYEGFGEEIGAAHGGLMHNKFCILDDDIVITGSTNPTTNGFERNDNNMVLIEGAAIAENYRQEYGELSGRTERKVPNPLITQTTPDGASFLIENHFCPEDDCEEQVLAELADAEESIRFMTFSFTSDPIGDLLVRKAKEGVAVTGVFEKRQNSQYSEYAKLEEAGIPVQFDSNPNTMHHKVFIIDAGTPDAVVITGSYNPTKSGNTRNDENILIIHDENIAERFLVEYGRITG